MRWIICLFKGHVPIRIVEMWDEKITRQKKKKGLLPDSRPKVICARCRKEFD
jgi:hypothetical protein